MKVLTTINNKFTESEVKKDNKFSCSRNFDECLKWLEKPLRLVNIKICDIKLCSINKEAGVPRWSVKMVFSTVLQNSQENIYVEVSY